MGTRIDNKKEVMTLNMKCALCGREIRGRDYIHADTPEKDIVHSMPCNWYDFERDTDNSA
jgi:hypothetical protein